MMKKIEDFKAGRYEEGYKYQYFVPETVNHQWQWSDGRLNELLERASIRLGELNSFAQIVPSVDLFVHLHRVKEAVISSRIEGTQTTINEALLPKEEISPEKRDDWLEVHNCSLAMNAAIEEMKTLPISSRLLKNTHSILMRGVRGESKTPGAFRTSQNWIGGASLDDAAFIPPADTYVNDLMGDLENFLHNDSIHVPSLIRIGIAHYQFETIHPFLDGNGRIGRLLITLYLINEKILAEPLLYLSTFFEQDKGLYYDNLTWVRTRNDLLGWLRYFLVGIEQTSSRAVETLRRILELKTHLEQEIADSFGKRTVSALKLMTHLFRDPVVRRTDVEEICQVSRRAASELVNEFERRGYLKEWTGRKRDQVFLFEPYVKLFD